MLYRRSCWLSILNVSVCTSSFKSYCSPLHHIIQVDSNHLVLTPSSLNFKTALSQRMIGLLVLPKDHGFNCNFILFSYSKTLSCFNLLELCNKCPRLDSSFYGHLSRSHLFPFIFPGHFQFIWMPFLLHAPSGWQQLAERLTSSLSSSSCSCHLVLAFMKWVGKKKNNTST